MICYCKAYLMSCSWSRASSWATAPSWTGVRNFMKISYHALGPVVFSARWMWSRCTIGWYGKTIKQAHSMRHGFGRRWHKQILSKRDTKYFKWNICLTHSMYCKILNIKKTILEYVAIKISVVLKTNQKVAGGRECSRASHRTSV
jgi:hypothetical protein